MRPSFIIRCILGLIFIYASIDKIRYPYEFLKVIYNYRIFPDALLSPIAIILPWLELLLGIALITGLFIEGAVLLTSLLLISFFLIILVNLIRGINIECGCFNLKANPAARDSMFWFLIRDLFLLSMAGYLMQDLWRKEKRG